jgi:hypothetical protein
MLIYPEHARQAVDQCLADVENFGAPLLGPRSVQHMVTRLGAGTKLHANEPCQPLQSVRV